MHAIQICNLQSSPKTLLLFGSLQSIYRCRWAPSNKHCWICWSRLGCPILQLLYLSWPAMAAGERDGVASLWCASPSRSAVVAGGKVCTWQCRFWFLQAGVVPLTAWSPLLSFSGSMAEPRATRTDVEVLVVFWSSSPAAWGGLLPFPSSGPHGCRAPALLLQCYAGFYSPRCPKWPRSPLVVWWPVALRLRWWRGGH
jgi:hypothetical protein